jgi:hypothetical protein
LRPRQWCILNGVASRFTTRWKSDHHLTLFDSFDESKTQFWFRKAVPALAGCYVHAFDLSV